MEHKNTNDYYDCCGDVFEHFLSLVAPEIVWKYIEDVGSYQGTVFAIGAYDGQIFVMKDYYGSCSGCGAWGEGGEPVSLEDVLGNGELFSSAEEALNFVNRVWNSESSIEIPTARFLNTLSKM